jgi:hypothetical protein
VLADLMPSIGRSHRNGFIASRLWRLQKGQLLLVYIDRLGPVRETYRHAGSELVLILDYGKYTVPGPGTRAFLWW